MYEYWLEDPDKDRKKVYGIADKKIRDWYYGRGAVEAVNEEWRKEQDNEKDVINWY